MAQQDGETLRGIETEERAYQETKEIIRAIDAGMDAEEIAAAVDGRPQGRKRCDSCGRRTGELMMSARGNVCPDCYMDMDD